jgi:hypothetical protein
VTILEGGEYLLGTRKFPKAENRYQKSNVVVACIAEYIKATYREASDDLDFISSPKMFYKQHPEIIKYPIKYDAKATSPFSIVNGEVVTNIPSTEFERTMYDEVFYCMQVGTPTLSLSSRQIFHLRKYYEMFEGDWSWFTKIYPSELFEELCSEDYLPEGVTPQAVIASLFDIDYEVLSDLSRCVKAPDGNYRLYVPGEDAVAYIPEALKERMSYDNMCSVVFDGTYIVLGDKPLHEYIEGCLGYYLTGNSFDLVQCL